MIAEGVIPAVGRGARTRITHRAIDIYLTSLDTVCERCGGRRAHRRRVQSEMTVSEAELADPNGRRLEWLRPPPKRVRGRKARPWAELTHQEQLAAWDAHYGATGTAEALVRDAHSG